MPKWIVTINNAVMRGRSAEAVRENVVQLLDLFVEEELEVTVERMTPAELGSDKRKDAEAAERGDLVFEKFEQTGHGSGFRRAHGRARVPGGWIYELGRGSATCFVFIPDATPCL